MKKEKNLIVIILAILALMLIISLAFYPHLPEQVASHWNAQGEVDGYMSRFWGTFATPLIIIGVVALLLTVPLIDPLKENIKKFKGYYYEFIMVLAIFMLLVQIQTLLWNVGIKVNVNIFVPILTGALFYFVGMLLEKAKRNWLLTQLLT